MDNSKYINKLIDELELRQSNELPPIEKHKKSLRESFYKLGRIEESTNCSDTRKFRFQVVQLGLKIGARRLSGMQYYVKLYKELRKIECEGFKARELNDTNKVQALREKWKKVKIEIMEIEERDARLGGGYVKDLKPYVEKIKCGAKDEDEDEIIANAIF